MGNKRVEEILGRNKAWERAVGDKDKDGVSNIIDCAPNNPHKQGIIHNLGRDVGGYVKEKRAGWKQRMAAGRLRRKKVAAARFKAREEAEITAGEKIERIKAEKKVAHAKSGGVIGAIGRGINAAASQTKKIARSAPVKRRKGKRKKARSVKRSAPREKFDITSGPKLF